MTEHPDDELVRCLSCHRPLAASVSRAIGRGPVCQAGLDHIARRGYRRGATGDQLALDITLPDPQTHGETL